MTQHINRSVIGPHQLLYLLYGDKEVYRLEARFSILSALRHRKNPADFTITLMTDQPEAFDGWPITVLSLSEETLGIWQGAGGYSHRRKACAIQAGVMLAGKTIFIDTDTVFFKDPALLFKRVTDDQFLMDEFELSWAQRLLGARVRFAVDVLPLVSVVSIVIIVAAVIRGVEVTQP